MGTYTTRHPLVIRVASNASGTKSGHFCITESERFARVLQVYLVPCRTEETWTLTVERQFLRHLAFEHRAGQQHHQTILQNGSDVNSHDDDLSCPAFLVISRCRTLLSQVTCPVVILDKAPPLTSSVHLCSSRVLRVFSTKSVTLRMIEFLRWVRTLESRAVSMISAFLFAFVKHVS